MTNSPSESNSMSEDIRALSTAFLLAKKEFNLTGKSGKNQQFGKYAKIEDIYNAVEEALGKHGILIWHFARPDAGVEYLYTRLIHSATGQFVEDCRILESEKPGNQEKGKANTYMKKYALLSLCAIATEDDDGESERKFIEEKNISPEQIIAMQNEIKSAKNGALLLQNIKSFNKVMTIADLKASQFDGVMAYIANKKE